MPTPSSPPRVSKAPDKKHERNLSIEKTRLPVNQLYAAVETRFSCVKRALSAQVREELTEMVEHKNKRRKKFQEVHSDLFIRLHDMDFDDRVFEMLNDIVGIMHEEIQIACQYLESLIDERDETKVTLKNISINSYLREIDEVRDFINNHLQGTYIFRATSESVIKDWTSNTSLPDETDNFALAYLDLHIQREAPPVGVTIDFKTRKWVDDQRDSFRKAIFERYDVVIGKNNDERYWCPILRSFLPSEEITAAHLSPTSYSESLMQYHFGNEDDHMFNIKNGIPLAKPFEKALDDAAIVLVPASDTDKDPDGGDESVPNEKRWKIMVLNDDMAPIEVGGEIFDKKRLHGRLLGFLCEARPGRRYAWFKFALTLLRRRRWKFVGWEADVKQFGQYWGSPKKYLRRSTLLKLAQFIGNTSTAEGFLEFSEDQPGTDPEKDLEIAKAVLRTMYPTTRLPSGKYVCKKDDWFEDFQDINLEEEKEQGGGKGKNKDKRKSKG